MVVGCSGSKKGRWEKVYRGVFISSFDYDIMGVSQVRLAKLRELNGKPPTEAQSRAISRLEELEELGGIDEGALLPELFSDEEIYLVRQQILSHS